MRTSLFSLALLMVTAALGCRTELGSRPKDAEVLTPPTASEVVAAEAPAASSPVAVAPGPPHTPDDGNDDLDPSEPPLQLPRRGRFEKVGAPPLGLTRVCGLTAHQGKLYSAHANQPLGTDGATIGVYERDADKPLRLGFDWNRHGEPRKGGGAGQGFLRVRRIAEGSDLARARLWVADADPPYGGLGLAEWGTEGYVFVSSFDGTFARARMPKHQPPLPPTVEGKPGALVLPRAYHVIDTIRWRGAVWASTGSVPPGLPSWRGPSPGALHRMNDEQTRMLYAVDYPNPYQNGVWRLTYLVRFRGKLLAGLQDYDSREPNDYVELECAADAERCEKPTLTPKRVTASGAAQTLRWYADRRGRLYWITWSREGGALRVTDDGERWQSIPLPAEAGWPTDVLRVSSADGDRLLVLGEEGLFQASAEPLVPGEDDFERVADVEAVLLPAKKKQRTRSPFVFEDIFCAAPMAAYGGELYVGGQRGGVIYRLAELK